MSTIVRVPYVVTGEFTDEELPGWFERKVWWPLAWKMPEAVRHFLWWRAWPNHLPLWPWNRAARWLVTHTPWWGGPGVSRPEIWRHRDRWPRA